MLFLFFKQNTAYEMRISDWSSDVCSSDLPEFIPDMGFRSANTRVNTRAFCQFQGFSGNFYIFFYSAGQAADDRVFDCFCDLYHRIEISRAGDWKASFDDVNSKLFQLTGDLDLFRELGRASCRERGCQ